MLRSPRIVMGALLCLLLAMAAYWSVLLDGQRSQRRQVEAQTWLRVSQLARAVSVQVQTLFSGLDYTLQSLASAYEERDRRAFSDAVQAVQGAYPPGTVMQIAVANAAGEILYSSLEPGGVPRAPVSILDREHFRVHAERAVQGMYVSRPVRGRVSQRWSIQLSRAVEREGTFLGVLVLSVSPDHIARYFEALSPEGTGDVITLLRDDGAYLARSELQDKVLGSTMPADRRGGFVPGATGGSYALVSPVDGVDRLYGWSRVPGQPLIVSVGLDRQVLLPMQAEFSRVVVRNGVGSLLIVLGALLAAWLALQRERSDRLRRRDERRFALLAQQAPGGLFQCRVGDQGQLQMVFTTPQFHRLHGLEPAADATRTDALIERVWPDDLPALVASVRASLATQRPWDHRYRVRDRAGPAGVRWLHGHAGTQREEDGTLLWHGYVHDVTQDEWLREAVRRSEERLRLTVRAVRDGLWEWECDAARVALDERCGEILGQPAQAQVVHDEDARALVHPADLPLLRERLRRHLAGGEDFRVELRLRTATGGWRSVEARGEATRRDAQGHALHMLGTITDIQERVEQARLIRALLDKGSALILVVTPGGEISYANERAARVFGLEAGAQEPRPLFRTLHPDGESFARLQSQLAPMRAQGSVRLEWLLRLADGDVHWFDMQGVPLDPQDGDGDVIWTLVDTDARRRAESALGEARRTLAAIIDRFPAGILVLDAQGGQVVAANHELVEILHIEEAGETLVGMPVAALCTLLPQPLGETMLRRGVEGAFPVGKSVQALADGRFVEVEALPLLDQGQALGHCWVVHDVTERRQRENRLETLALTDALTGVPNRRAFLERLDTEVRQLAAGLVERSVVLMLDIDHFKRVNDTWGHATGDVVLQDLARTVLHALRKDDMVGRIGGEEFAVLLSGASAEAGQERAEALRRAVEAREIVLEDGTALRITVSLGVYAMAGPGESGRQSLERADMALYVSKRQGRNRCTLWREDLADQAPPAGGERR